jgi:hypothetical protein
VALATCVVLAGAKSWQRSRSGSRTSPRPCSPRVANRCANSYGPTVQAEPTVRRGHASTATPASNAFAAAVPSPANGIRTLAPSSGSNSGGSPRGGGSGSPAAARGRSGAGGAALSDRSSCRGGRDGGRSIASSITVYAERNSGTPELSDDPQAWTPHATGSETPRGSRDARPVAPGTGVSRGKLVGRHEDGADLPRGEIGAGAMDLIGHCRP